MEEWLHLVTKEIVVIIDAFLTGLWAAFPAPIAHRRFREILVRYGRWLVAGLTFQLAADIIGTSIAPSWQEVGQLGAIAVIRTFLNFFLERDLAELGTETPRRSRADPQSQGELRC